MMAQVKAWVLNRVIGDGDASAWRGEVSDLATSNGIRSEDVLRTDPPHAGIAITMIGPLTPAQALTVHNLPMYEVLAAQYTNAEENGEDAGEPYPSWGTDDPFTDPRWVGVRDGLVAMGLDAVVIDTWKTNNPDGTPREFYHALSNYLGGKPDPEDAA